MAASSGRGGRGEFPVAGLSPSHLLCLLLALGLSLCPFPLGADVHEPAVELEPAERAWLAAHPVIRVATDPSFAPYEYRDGTGRFRGLTVDYLDRLAPLLGVRFERSVEDRWSEVFAALEAGRYDMATCVIPTAARREFLDFAWILASKRYMIFGQSDSAYVEDLGELDGDQVGVVGGFAVVEYLRRDRPGLRLVEFGDTREALAALARGRVDWFVNDLTTTGWYIQEQGLTTIKAVGETPYELPLSFAARRDRAPLGGILAKAMAALPDPELAALRSAWFAARAAPRFDWRLVAIVMAVLGILALGSLAWVRVLAARVRAHTADLARANASLRAEIEERRRAEARLAAAVEERGLLLAELNHRVKNNLQLALSLVRLSSADAGEGEHAALDDAASRLEAIARVHVSLQSAPSASGLRVDLGEYLAGLAEDERALWPSDRRLRMELGLPSGLAVSMKLAVNLGLVVNELLTNARKYAFPGDRAGLIRLEVRGTEDGGLLLEVADDGVGFDPSARARRDSLGMGIVRSVAWECHGRLELDTAPGRGTLWRLSLPPESLAPGPATVGAASGQGAAPGAAPGAASSQGAAPGAAPGAALGAAPGAAPGAASADRRGGSDSAPA